MDLEKESEREGKKELGEKERGEMNYIHLGCHATDTSFNKFITEIVTDLFVISQVCLRTCHIRYI